MKEDNVNINYYDKNGMPNGYFEYYPSNDTKLIYRCNFKKGQPIGYDEYHSITQTMYHIR